MSTTTAPLVASLLSAGLPAGSARTASRIAAIMDDNDDRVVAAIALALSAVDAGSVLVDLSRPAAALPPREDPAETTEPEWPEPARWVSALAASPVTTGIDAPLQLQGNRVYLRRYWNAEGRIADNLRRLAGDAAARRVGDTPLGTAPAGLDAEQSAAVASMLDGGLTILTGGPGTGKTHTVATALGSMLKRPGEPPLVALAAPTGKAAARLKEAIANASGTADAHEVVATTLHGLLQPIHGQLGSFRRNRRDPLPHDVIIVDEMSMVSVALLDSLLEAVRPGATVVLVGDPDQLASVEAGSAFADIVRSGTLPVSRLVRNHRSTGAIPDLADAIREGRSDTVVELLRNDSGLHWDERAAAQVRKQPSDLVREWLREWGQGLADSASSGDTASALRWLNRVRVLTAHRHGPAGASEWERSVVDWLSPAARGLLPLGEPRMVTQNRVVPGLYNGDTGVVMATPDGPRVAFEPDLSVSPERLGSAARPAYALTTHKAQGSEFGRVVLVLPDPGSRVLTRELLYTAVTRAREGMAIIGSEESLRAGIERAAARASGLDERLRGASRP